MDMCGGLSHKGGEELREVDPGIEVGNNGVDVIGDDGGTGIFSF